MSTVLLPVQMPPIIGFVHHAYPLSIMLNNPASVPWLYSNYIQLSFDTKKEVSALSFNFFHYNYPYNGQFVSPFVYNIWFSKRMILEHSNLEAFIKDSVDNRYYVYIYCDEYYIPNKYSHRHGIHQAHDILVHGYDDTAKEYALTGYDENGSFRLTRVSYEQLETAFRPSEHLYKSFHDNVQLFQESETEWKFRIEPVIELLKDYVLGRDTSLRYGISRHGRPELFGTQVYPLIQNYAESIHAGELGLDIRPFHLLWEHKKLMQSRIRFLMDNGHVVPDLRLIEAFDEVERSAFEIRGHVIKAATTQDREYMRPVASGIRLMAEREKDVLSRLIEELEAWNGRRPDEAADNEWDNAVEFHF